MMNKSDLILNISNKFSYLKKDDVEQATSQILNLISETLINQDRVEIRGFGSFSSRRRPARLSRNPKTGTSITLTSKFYPYYRASSLLKQSVKK